MKTPLQKYLTLICATFLCGAFNVLAENTASITIQAGAPGTQISPNLFGIFFEDINYAADGGLYAELVQNNSFEYSTADHQGWNGLTSWQLVEQGNGKGAVTVETNAPLNGNNPHYAVLTVERGGAGVGLANSGYDGMVVKKGGKYNVALFARQTSGPNAPLTVRLESKSGEIYGEASFPHLTKDWKKYTAVIQAKADDAKARLVLLTAGTGKFCFDTVSLFPQDTFHHRPNGMRADLAQAIANLHPKFMRFPGGCLVHGQGLGNMYHWKNTIGPIEQRKGQRDLWGYHQSYGLGFYEYFQFCADIGATPLPVVAAGVSCQFAPGGQQGIPMDQMKSYVQDVLDLIQYANGPTNSVWGAKRAAAGHPAPFHLQYLGVGNEDQQSPEFGIRFKMIDDAIKAKYPHITVIGTVGPFPSGEDFDEGWKFAWSMHLNMVDEHYYEPPEWFLHNLHRYDNYSRFGPKVYVGEYASKGNTLFNALAEAAFMTGFERNGDVVRMASYAPLLGREDHLQWKPDLIYFNNTTVCPSVNYYVQQLFSENQGNIYLPTEVSTSGNAGPQTGFLLGAWDTQVEYKDLKVVSGNQTLLDESFSSGAKDWTPVSGHWSVTDGMYVQSANGQPTLSFLNSKIDQSNYTLTLKARKTGGKEGFLIGFGARDTKNYYWWNIGGWDNTRDAIEKTSNGAKTTLSGGGPGSVELNRWYDIKIAVANGHVRCYLDGKLVQDLVDEGVSGTPSVAASCVKDSKSGDVILKLVNVTPQAVQGQVNLAGIGNLEPVARRTVLAGNPKAEDTFSDPTNVIPVSSKMNVSKSFATDLPADSLTVIRMKTR